MTIPANVFSIISIKGGVGKTTTTANLGAAFAQLGKKVLLVDANITAGGLGLHCGVTKPTTSLQDVLLGKRSPSAAMTTISEKIDLLPSIPAHQHVDTLRLRHRLETIRGDYDIILIDSSPTLNHELLGAMLAADELLVVSTPDHPTAYTTMYATSIAKKRGMPIAGIVLNQVRDKPFELTLEQIEQQADAPVLSVIPYETRMQEAIAHTTSLVHRAPTSDAAIAYLELAACLLGDMYHDPRLLQRAKRFFFDERRKDQANRKRYREEKKRKITGDL